MYPGIFDETMADNIWQIATDLVPVLFVIISLVLVMKLIKSVMP